MRVLVLGSNGMLGHVVSLYLQEQGHDVTGLARNDSPFINTIICDATDLNKLKDIISFGKYDYIVNSLALLVSESEKRRDEAVLVNSLLPHNIARVIKDTSTRLIQISTDSVFSGSSTTGYSELSPKDSHRFYDITKSLGEVQYGGNVSIRASVIGLELKPSGMSLMNWFLRQSGTVSGYDAFIWSGVTAPEYAKAVHEVMQDQLDGIVHLTNNKGISKGDLLRLLNVHVRKDKVDFTSELSVRMQRILLNCKFPERLRVPSYEQMIIEQVGWIKSHRHYYQYYYGDQLERLIDM